MAIFGLTDAIKRAVAGHEAGEYAKEAQVGKLGTGAKLVWTFLDGWKTWIVAVVAVYKLLCHDCQTAGYLGAILSGVGWDHVTAAFDPAQAATAFAVVLALGHHLFKAVQQYRAGVPLSELNSAPVVVPAFGCKVAVLKASNPPQA